MNNYSFFFYCTFLLLILPASLLQGQQAELRYANQLFREEKYDESLELYRELIQRNPDNVAAVDRKSNALISLKRYDDAIRVLEAFMQRNPEHINIGVRIGEAWHMAENRDEALASWTELIENNRRNVQVYRIVSESMSSRREYEAAAEMLIEAREQLGNSQLFAFEVAQNFTAAGEYEKAMLEFSRLIQINAGYITTIQRQIARFDDPYYRDIAIMEFEEFSRNLAPESEAWVAHRQMLIWLYMERGLHRRALVTARNLEDTLDDNSFPVFNIGRTFMNLNEFELAKSAFERYTQDSESPLFAEAREQLALLYINRSRYLIDNNLDFGAEANQLYRDAYQLLSELDDIMGLYRSRDNVLVLLTEISIDYLKDAELAKKWIQEFEGLQGRMSNPVMADYLKGRLYIFEQEFTRARVSLTRANRAARTGDLAEKTRYFLSLNDFYAGDFEYSKIQMRSLRRQNTSYYANNALRLSGWLQDGMVSDSATTELNLYSNARFEFESGNDERALEILSAFFTENDLETMKSDALILTGTILRKHDPELGFQLLHQFVKSESESSQLENVLWLRARLADALFHLQNSIPESGISENILSTFTSYLSETDISEASSSDEDLLLDEFLIDQSKVIELYEEILMQFPQGFYGTASRERIRTLMQTASLP